MSSVIVAALEAIKIILYIFLSFLAICTVVSLGYRLWVEPIKGVCKSKAKLYGKTVLVTGGNSGIGLETARDLARRGAKVIIASRNVQKSLKAVEDIIQATGNNNVEYQQVDLSKLSSVHKFAEYFNKNYDRLDILVNNAGCAVLGDRPSEDGLDKVMQVNYFGPFLLTNLLLDKIIASKPSRIVIVASIAHHFAKLSMDNLDGLSAKYFTLKYSNSKLCDILWTRSLAKRPPTGVTVNCLHPGAVKTNIFRRITPWLKNIINIMLLIFFKTAEQGAQTLIHLCVSEELENITGLYFQDCKQLDVSCSAKNDDLAEEVWNKSLLLTKSPVILHLINK